MYFSGIDRNSITIDDPSIECIITNPELFIRVLNNRELNTRIFLDTHLLRIRSRRNDQKPSLERLLPKSKASVDVGNISSISVLGYTSRALVTAEFREISSDAFKDRYLPPAASVYE